MIRYTLKCEQNHVFDGWFPSAEGFERLRAANLTSCTICGSTDVHKCLMAPQVQTARDRANPASEVPAVDPDASAPPAIAAPHVADAPSLLSTPETPLAKAIARLREEVESSSHYVGQDFATEARAMHTGETPERAIYGEARLDEARALIEDGIPVLPLPFANKTKTN